MFRKKATDPDDHDAYLALRYRDFRFLIGGNFLVSLAQAILSVIVGYELYQRTGSALALGMVGLVQIIPNVLISIPAGQYVDQHDQKRIVMAAAALNGCAAAGLALITHYTGPLVLMYLCLFLIGLGRAFLAASRSTLVAAIIPPQEFGNASAWSSSANQTASILGPAVGGFGVALVDDPSIVFGFAAGMLALASVLWSQMNPRKLERSREKMTKDSLLAGFKFIYSRKTLLAAMTLDVVAVLMGGATALMPIFAEDVLHVGATGLGLMRSAPALGAVLASIAIAHKGPFESAGRTLLSAVVGFGIVTIVFGVSRTLPLSLVALTFLGVFDSISVVIRNTLQLTLTPDHMRGRIGAIHFLFVGMSNEFGEFESGVAAAVLGATTAVVVGGLGTLLVVPIIALAWPEVRRLKRIENVQEVPLPEPVVQPVPG